MDFQSIDLDLHFQGQILEFLFFCQYLAKGESYCTHYYCHRIGCEAFPSNGAITNVVHYDLNLNFQGHEVLNVNISIYQRICQTAEDSHKFQLIRCEGDNKML